MIEKNSNNKDVTTYPHNLLIAVKGKSNRALPRNITRDILAGVEYALSLLDSDEQWLLNLRYREALSQQEVGERLFPFPGAGLPSRSEHPEKASHTRKMELHGTWDHRVF